MSFFGTDESKLIYIVPQEEILATEEEVTVADPEVDTIIRLTATTDFDKTESATLTQYPVSTGASISDHYRINGTSISFSGIISDTSSGFFSQFENLTSDESTVVSYIKSLKSLMKGDRSPLVTIYLPDGNGESDCVITNLQIKKDSSVGNGYKVDISAKKLLLAQADLIVTTGGAEYEPETKQNQEAGTTTDPGQQIEGRL